MVPDTLMNHLMLKDGVCNGQSITISEFQKQNTTRIQIRELVPPNHASPGHSIIANMGIEIPQKNNEILRWQPLQDATHSKKAG